MKSREAGPPETAESLAIQALTYLAADAAELERFLTLSGLDLASLRTAAAQPGFLAAVLDHIASNDSLMLAFATHVSLSPADVERARSALSGPRWQRDYA